MINFPQHKLPTKIKYDLCEWEESTQLSPKYLFFLGIVA